jgi:hypothetical protein
LATVLPLTLASTVAALAALGGCGRKRAENNGESGDRNNGCFGLHG